MKAMIFSYISLNTVERLRRPGRANVEGCERKKTYSSSHNQKNTHMLHSLKAITNAPQ